MKVGEEGKEQSLYCTCDFLVNANGHESVKNIPNLPGIHSYEGGHLHMHDLRNVAEIKAKEVMVVGSGFGGNDLTC